VKSKKCQCDECDKTLKNNHNLKEHIKSAHIKAFECPYEMCQIAGKRFGHKRHLKTHVERYHMKEREKCEFCEKFFYDKNSRKKHVNEIHLKIKPYVCIICHKCFPRRGSLDIHMKTHNCMEEKIVFECKYCGFKFIHKNNLHKHLKTKHMKTEI